MINPVPGDMHWVETGLPPIKPPDYRPQAGRPRKQRKRGPDEPKNTSKVELVWESHVRNALNLVTIKGHTKALPIQILYCLKVE